MAKFQWDESQAKTYNTLITTAGVLGVAFGSLVGGKTVTIGRRKAAILTQLLAIVGAALTMVLNLPMICIGRFICGITSGHANIIMSKSIDETVPSEVSGHFGVLLNLYTCIGIMISFFLGGILPTEED